MRKDLRAFVIRLWAPGDEVEAHAAGADELHGVVEPIGSHEATPFGNETELLELLHAGRQRGDEASEQGERRQ